VVAEGRQQPTCAEKDREGCQHGIAHIDGMRRADENAVELKRPDPEQRRARRPGQISVRRRARRRVHGEKRDEPRSEHGQHHRHQQRDPGRPRRRHLDGQE